MESTFYAWDFPAAKRTRSDIIMTVMLGEFMLLSRFMHIIDSKKSEVQYLTFPLALFAVKCEQQNIFDRLANCRTIIDNEHARASAVRHLRDRGQMRASWRCRA